MITTRVHLPLRITHSGSQLLKRTEQTIPLVFSGEDYFRTLSGIGIYTTPSFL